jgi:protein-S-isoprenylcysteine O-methyltransferase Ste14
MSNLHTFQEGLASKLPGLIDLGGKAPEKSLTIASPMSIADVQIVRKIVLAAATAVGILMFAFVNSRLGATDSIHELIEWSGIVAIVVCIIGRTWTSLYIAGRKIDQLVTVGPYSIVRNPLYVFSILGAAGAGAQLGSLVAGFVSGLLAWLVFTSLRSKRNG